MVRHTGPVSAAGREPSSCKFPAACSPPHLLSGGGRPVGQCVTPHVGQLTPDPRFKLAGQSACWPVRKPTTTYVPSAGCWPVSLARDHFHVLSQIRRRGGPSAGGQGATPTRTFTPHPRLPSSLTTLHPTSSLLPFSKRKEPLHFPPTSIVLLLHPPPPARHGVSRTCPSPRAMKVYTPPWPTIGAPPAPLVPHHGTKVALRACVELPDR